jgi:hypothetical protein
MPFTQISENLDCVFNQLQKLIFYKGERLEPNKDNALELMILHDLYDLIKPAKKGASFDEDLLKYVLEQEYIKQTKQGKFTFSNFRQILEKPEYLKHLAAMLND